MEHLLRHPKTRLMPKALSLKIAIFPGPFVFVG